MKTTGVSNIPKFGLLFFSGHPRVHWKMKYWKRSIQYVDLDSSIEVKLFGSFFFDFLGVESRDFCDSPLFWSLYTDWMLPEFLGMDGDTKWNEFSGKLQRGGSFSIQKFIFQIMATFNRNIWSWNWYKIVISEFRECFFKNSIEKNQNKTHFEEGSSSLDSLRDGSRYQTNFHVHVFHTIWPSYLLAYKQPFMVPLCTIIKNLQHNFPKMRRRGVEGRLEFFGKFIRFASRILP